MDLAKDEADPPRKSPPGRPPVRSSAASGPGSASRSVPLLRPDLPPLESYTVLLEEVWKSKMLSNFAAFGKRLEALAASYTGEPESLAVVNCDIGLTLAIAALEPPPGSEAILPSFTFASTVNAVRWNRLRPRFADVDPLTWCLRPESVAQTISPDTGLLVGTHAFGVPCDVEALTALAESNDIPLVFDAAHAVGTWVGDRHVAAFGHASVVSLSGTKVVTSGEGGLAIIRAPEAAERFRYLRNYGFRGDYVPRYLGLNAKLSELHAALGCLTLARVEESVAKRAHVADTYRDVLGRSARVSFQSVPQGVRAGHAYFAIDAGEWRDGLGAHLAASGIETKKYFRPLHLMPSVAGAEPRSLPVTERLASGVLCLPLYPDLSDGDLEYVCDTTLAYLEAAENASG